MNRIALLLICVAASPAIFAQNKTSRPVAVLLMAGDAESSWNASIRPRIVGTRVPTAVNTPPRSSIVNVELRAFAMINRKRIEAGLMPLMWSGKLEEVARTHSKDMADRDYFAHRSPSGKRVEDRADDAKLGDWKAIGENIAVNRGFDDPIARAVDAWMISPLHKRNLLTGSWTESAIGIAVASDGSYYFTQVFLKR